MGRLRLDQGLGVEKGQEFCSGCVTFKVSVSYPKISILFHVLWGQRYKSGNGIKSYEDG